VAVGRLLEAVEAGEVHALDTSGQGAPPTPPRTSGGLGRGGCSGRGAVERRADGADDDRQVRRRQHDPVRPVD